MKHLLVFCFFLFLVSLAHSQELSDAGQIPSTADIGQCATTIEGCGDRPLSQFVICPSGTEQIGNTCMNSGIPWTAVNNGMADSMNMLTNGTALGYRIHVTVNGSASNTPPGGWGNRALVWGMVGASVAVGIGSQQWEVPYVVGGAAAGGTLGAGLSKVSSSFNWLKYESLIEDAENYELKVADPARATQYATMIQRYKDAMEELAYQQHLASLDIDTPLTEYGVNALEQAAGQEQFYEIMLNQMRYEETGGWVMDDVIDDVVQGLGYIGDYGPN